MGNTSKRVPLFCAASLACSLAFAGAGCAEGGAVSADSPVVADGVTTSEPFLSPIYTYIYCPRGRCSLDEVTKPTLVSLVFYQAGTAEGRGEGHGGPARARVLRRGRPPEVPGARGAGVTDLLARVVSMRRPTRGARGGLRGAPRHTGGGREPGDVGAPRRRGRGRPCVAARGRGPPFGGALAAFPMAGCSQEGSVAPGRSGRMCPTSSATSLNGLRRTPASSVLEARPHGEAVRVHELARDADRDRVRPGPRGGPGGLSEAARPAGGLRSDGQGAGSRRLRR